MSFSSKTFRHPLHLFGDQFWKDSTSGAGSTSRQLDHQQLSLRTSILVDVESQECSLIIILLLVDCNDPGFTNELKFSGRRTPNNDIGGLMLPDCVVEHTERAVDTIVIVTSGIVVDRSFVNKTLRSMLAKGESDIQSTHFFAYPSDTKSELRSSQVLFQDSLALGVDDSDPLPVAPTYMVSNSLPSDVVFRLPRILQDSTPEFSARAKAMGVKGDILLLVQVIENFGTITARSLPKVALEVLRPNDDVPRSGTMVKLPIIVSVALKFGAGHTFMVIALLNGRFELFSKRMIGKSGNRELCLLVR